jgi:hypothetical protein
MKKYILTILILVISIIFLIYLSTKLELSTTFSENTGLYLFSALIQANAAIFSIVGVFYIFRLQSIQYTITNIFNALYNENINIRQVAEDFKIKNIDDKKVYVGKMTGNDHISNYYRNWLEYELEQNEIKNKIKNPLIAITLLIVLQIFFLIISHGIHLLGVLFEIISFALIGLFQIYILIIVVYSILTIINRKSV